MAENFGYLGTVAMAAEQYARIPERDRPLVWQTLMEKADLWPGIPLPYYHEPTHTHYMFILGDPERSDAGNADT